MKRIICLLLVAAAYIPLQAQITANPSTRPPEELQLGNQVGDIVITDYYTQDSLDCEFTCVVIPESNAIRLTASHPKGMYIVFRRGYTKLYTQDFEDNVIFLDIKATFEGKYYIDIYDEERVKIKSYLVERVL